MLTKEQLEIHPLTAVERDWLDRFLSYDIDGIEQLRAQAATVQARWVESRGQPAMLFSVNPTSPRATVKSRVPVEAMVRDADGMGVHLLLHVVDGYLSEIEVYREDGNPLRHWPDLAAKDVEWIAQVRE